MFCMHWRVTHDAKYGVVSRQFQSINAGRDNAHDAIDQTVKMHTARPSGAVRGLTRVQHGRSAAATSPSSGHTDSDPSGTIAALAGAAIALGARALTAEQIEAAQLTNQLLRRHFDEPFLPAALALARSFHRQLLGACPNVHMVELLNAQLAAVGVSPPVSVSRVQLERVADAHDQLLAMVRADEPSNAIERLARRHADDLHVCWG